MKVEMIANPLVSVVVVTYNSSKTVIETLNSIEAQTYDNIELIVSDDYSRDNTVDLVKVWLEEHRDRFVRTELLTINANTGTAGNLNRGFNRAKGEWIKGIAGDDKLVCTCIHSNIEYIRNNSNVEILLSKVKLIGDSELIKKYQNLFIYGALELQRRELLKLLLTGNFLPASTLFISKNVYDDLDGFDESMPLLEDWPFWIKALFNKKEISFNNEYTTLYRLSESSVSMSSTPNPLYLSSLKVFNDFYLPRYQWKISKLIWFHCKCNKAITTKSHIMKIVLYIMLYINPFTYYKKYLYSKAYKLNNAYED